MQGLPKYSWGACYVTTVATMLYDYTKHSLERFVCYIKQHGGSLLFISKEILCHIVAPQELINTYNTMLKTMI